jgi:hypothetical protein
MTVSAVREGHVIGKTYAPDCFRQLTAEIAPAAGGMAAMRSMGMQICIKSF